MPIVRAAVALNAATASPPYDLRFTRTVGDVVCALRICTVGVIFPPPTLRTGIAPELCAAVTPHWSETSSATLESGTPIEHVVGIPLFTHGMAGCPNVETGSTVNPDCEIAYAVLLSEVIAILPCSFSGSMMPYSISRLSGVLISNCEVLALGAGFNCGAML